MSRLVAGTSLVLFLLALYVGDCCSLPEHHMDIQHVVLSPTCNHSSLFRYLRLIVHIVAFARLTPRPLAVKPRFTPGDVTVIIPTTFSDPEALVDCLGRILGCCPAQVIVVTSNSRTSTIEKCCDTAGIQAVQIIGIPKLNKRHQLLAGLKKVHTDITVFADDDVFWPNCFFLHYLLACFEDDRVGAAGPRQRVRRSPNPSIWNFLGIAYIERRNFNTGATNGIDGGLSTLSGRTSAYRTRILKTAHFFQHCAGATSAGRLLTTDDDKCLTQYVFSHGWDIALTFNDNAVVETTLEDGPRFLAQCLRWARSHWRGNLSLMRNPDADYWYRRHPWTLYAVYMGQFQGPAVVVDGLLAWLLWRALAVCERRETRCCGLAAFGAWLLGSKTVKLVPHLRRCPGDVRFLPVAILFGYAHGLLSLYALLTLHDTA